jgi:hypothetical protein
MGHLWGEGFVLLDVMLYCTVHFWCSGPQRTLAQLSRGHIKGLKVFAHKSILHRRAKKSMDNTLRGAPGITPPQTTLLVDFLPSNRTPFSPERKAVHPIITHGSSSSVFMPRQRRRPARLQHPVFGPFNSTLFRLHPATRGFVARERGHRHSSRSPSFSRPASTFQEGRGTQRGEASSETVESLRRCQHMDSNP